MIRLSTEKDINGIIHLWNEAFGDSEEEIRFFLDNCFKENNTLICEINGEVASMLFLIEGDMSVKNTDYPSYYLYAACTLEKYRGRGLMAQLLSFAKSVAGERGKYFICLKPGEKSLFDFYEKHGYKSVFYINKTEHQVCDLIDNASVKFPDTACDREKLRNEAFSIHPYFKWDKHFIDFAFLHNEFFGGYSFESCKGYSLYNINNNFIVVKETTFTDIFPIINSLDNDLLSNSKKIIVNFPPFIRTDGEVTPSAMITAVNEGAEKILSNINYAYLGLTLE